MNTTPPFDPADVEAVAHLIKTHMWIRHDSAMDDASLVGADESAAAIMTLLAQRGRLVEGPILVDQSGNGRHLSQPDPSMRPVAEHAEPVAEPSPTRSERLWCSAAFGVDESDIDMHHVIHLVDQIDGLYELALPHRSGAPPADRSNHATPTPSPCRTADGSRAGVADGDAAAIQDGRGGAVDDAEATPPAEPVVTEAMIDAFTDEFDASARALRGERLPNNSRTWSQVNAALSAALRVQQQGGGT